MNQIAFNTPYGEFSLYRLPVPSKGDLRAWDAADELILKYLFENNPVPVEQSVLIINDSFGALATALHGHQTVSWGDSYVAHQATTINFNKNKLNLDSCQLLPSTRKPTSHFPLVLIKIPKTLALLEEQLYQLKAIIDDDTVIIAGGMSRHIHRSTLNLFEKIIGTTQTSRATKKARLIFCKPGTHKQQTDKLQSPYPKTIYNDQLGLKLINHANVFAQEQLDIGTHFMLEQLNKCPKSDKIIDLGCGNGALGIAIQRMQTHAKLFFVDESYLAIKSAEESYQANITTSQTDNKPSFINSNILSAPKIQDNQFDLTLCNPPFHQAHSIGDQIAWQMFKQSQQKLKTGGELWVIGNRHLNYHIKLKKCFGNCKTIASNRKFVVLKAQKQGSDTPKSI